MRGLNDTHDAKRRSWVGSANQPDAEFPIQNLPFGIFRRRGTSEAPRGGVAIGDRVLDLAGASRASLLQGKAAAAAAKAASEATLNRLMAMGPSAWSALRAELSGLLAAGEVGEAETRGRVEPHLVPLAEAEMQLPALIGDYTDFYA